MARRNKKPSKARKIIKTVIFSVIGLIIAVAIGFAVWIFATTDLSIGTSMSTLNLKLTSVVYCQDSETGEWVESDYLSSDENRIWADIDAIPNYLEDAFVAIEDQRFIYHHGVDWKRTFGAVMGELFGGSDYGGSTITQQLVKNLTGERDRSYTRKIREIIRALALETKLSKEQILELYLNSIYLGEGCNGVEAASHVYFNKTVSQLSLAEAASIAGITQYPAVYDPFINKEKNIEKQRTVLGKMLELEYISQEEYDEAIAEELNFVRGDIRSASSQSYFVDAVVEDVIEDLCEEYEYSEAIATQLVYNGGLKIYATVDPSVQALAEEVFENESDFPVGSGDNKIQGAMAITDPSNGYVKAIVGGRGEKNLSRGLNRATQTTRQPGSAIKPLSVYAPAIDLGLITPDSSVEDVPININGWQPKNYYNSYYGNMTIRRAVNLSSNIPAIKVLQKVTVEKSFEYMTEKLGFTTLIDREERNGKVYTDKTLPSLALGGLTDGVNLIEMCAAYATFPNNGTYIEPITYVEVRDNNDKIVLKNSQEEHTAFKATTAYQMNQLLKGVVTSGTGVGAGISGIDTAGKTGTTDNDTDRWFVGYTPYYVGAVWIGYDNSRGLPSTSVNPALSIWKKVMPKIHSELENKSFDRPANMSGAYVCYKTGLLATDHCYDDEGNSTSVFRYYDRQNRPTGTCPGDHGVPPEEVPKDGEDGENPDATSNGGESGDASSSGNSTSQSGSEAQSPAPIPEAPPENITE